MKEKLRRVAVYKHVHQRHNSTVEFDYCGLFHQWGIDYEEFDNGPGPFTAAIVEREDGRVALVYASLIRFEPDNLWAAVLVRLFILLAYAKGLPDE